MPFIRITVLGPALTSDQIHRLQQGTTDLMTSVMRKPIEGTSVLVEQIGRGGWTVAGAPRIGWRAGRGDHRPWYEHAG